MHLNSNKHKIYDKRTSSSMFLFFCCYAADITNEIYELKEAQIQRQKEKFDAIKRNVKHLCVFTAMLFQMDGLSTNTLQCSQFFSFSA